MREVLLVLLLPAVSENIVTAAYSEIRLREDVKHPDQPAPPESSDFLGGR